MKIYLVLILLVFSVTLFSCKTKSTEVSEPESGFIEITKAQFKTESMEIGEPILSPFADLVHFTGIIIPSVNGRAEISLPVEGVITKIYYMPGELVNKGAALFEISGNEFIDLQKDFAEAAALLSQLKSDYDRKKELDAENIGTKKDLILSESLFIAENAKFNALKIKIEQLGLNTEKIEAGSFYSSFSLKAPIKGFVNSINTTIGQYVESREVIAEIIDNSTFQVKLSVFAKDISKVKQGQNVEFYSAGNKIKKEMAKIKLVGKAIDMTTKSIDCFAEIENMEMNTFVNNEFVEGDIIVDKDSVFSIPENALIKSENEDFVLVLEKETDEIYYFNKLKINTGRRTKGFVELIEVPNSKNILLKGVYNIQIE